MASLKKLILHGKFKELWDGEFSVYADSAAEVLEAFQTQTGVLTPKLGDDPHCGKLVGFDTEEEIFGPTDVEEIHLVPTVMGAKKGGIFQILVAVVLVAVAVIFPEFAIFGLDLATPLLAAGIGMALGGIVSLLMPVPSLEAGEDPEASKYLGADRNTVKMGTRIPIMYGTGPAYGHILSFNVDSTSIIRGTWPV